MNFKQRLYAHRSSKRFRDYKISNVVILERLDVQDKAVEREKYWVNFYDTYNRGLNLTPTGGADCGERFNTLGMSFIRGKKWCHDPNTGKHKSVTNESEIPKGWVAGRYKNGMKGKRHSKQTKEKFRLDRLGKVASRKYSEHNIREVFNKYKERPFIVGVGTKRGASGSKLLSYERGFANQFSSHFGMTSNHIFNLLTKPSIAWDYLWNEIIGKEKSVTYSNT